MQPSPDTVAVGAVGPRTQTVRSRLQSARSRLAAAIVGGHRLRRQTDLIASLNDVADAVSSALGIEEVLACIVERAKLVSDTDKAVLVLADEHGGALDMDTIIVRGRRQQHPQEWWQDRLEVLGDRVFESREVAVEYCPAQDAWLLASPVRVRDHPIGLICAINASNRPFSDIQMDFLAILSAFAASAIENTRLAEQSRYVLLAGDRDRIAREMHDGVVQSLFSISLGLELCKKQVLRDPAMVAVRLEDLQSQLNMAMTELRRFIYDLRPMKLTELGLKGAIEYWIHEVTQGTGIRGSFVAEGVQPLLSPSTEACLYRVAKESVSNAVKHSRASRVDVRLSYVDGLLRLIITDDGDGFDAPAAISDGRPGLGLKSIRERVAREGGALSIQSTQSAGTRITVELRTGDA